MAVTTGIPKEPNICAIITAMVIHQAFKFRLYPNVEQRIFLARQFGCARYVYNVTVQLV